MANYSAPQYSPAGGYGTQDSGYVFTQQGWTPQFTPVNQGVVAGANISNVPQQSSSGGSGSNNNSGSNYDAVRNNEQQRGDESNRLIEDAYNAVLGALGNAENRVRGMGPTFEQEAQGQFDVNKALLDTSKQESEQQVGEQDIQTEERNIDVQNDARRLFNQLLQKGIQTFGGASGASEGYQTALATEQQRNSAVRAREYSTAKRQIDQAKQKITTDYNNAVLKLQQVKQSAINSIKTWMAEKLNEIDMRKAEAGQNKAMAKLQVLQQMRNNLFNIESAIAEQKNALDAQNQQYTTQIGAAEQNLLNSVNQGQAGYDSFGYTPEASGMVMGDNTQANPQQTYTGITGGNDEEDLFPMMGGGGGGSW